MESCYTIKGKACNDFICFFLKALLDDIFKIVFKHLLIETHFRLATGHRPTPFTWKPPVFPLLHGNKWFSVIATSLPAPTICVPDMHIQLCASNFISPPLSPETQNLSRRQKQDRWPITPPSYNSQICIQNLWKHINFLHLHVDKKYLPCISVYINDSH